MEIYKDCCTKAVEHPYLTHRVHRSVSDMSFVPFEDVMGIGHEAGFASILSPGSGRASYDAYEVNPYQSKTQRREAEVRQLLEKVRPELISLDPEKIGEVDAVSAAEGALERAKKISLKPSEVKDFEPRSRSGGRGGTAKRYHVKKTVVAEGRMVSWLLARIFCIFFFQLFTFIPERNPGEIGGGHGGRQGGEAEEEEGRKADSGPPKMKALCEINSNKYYPLLHAVSREDFSPICRGKTKPAFLVYGSLICTVPGA